MTHGDILIRQPGRRAAPAPQVTVTAR
jgi:hypothetical protein